MVQPTPQIDWKGTRKGKGTSEKFASCIIGHTDQFANKAATQSGSRVSEGVCEKQHTKKQLGRSSAHVSFVVIVIATVPLDASFGFLASSNLPSAPWSQKMKSAVELEELF